MKAIAKSVINTKKIAKKNEEEKKPLVTSSDNPRYNDGHEMRPRKISDNVVSPSLPRKKVSSTGSEYAFPMRQAGSSSSFTSVGHRTGPYQSPPNSPKVTADMDIDFNQVPFQFYRRESDSWNEALCQAIIWVLVCIITPSLIVAVLMYLNGRRLRYKGRMKKEDKDRQGHYFLLLLLITFLKDFMVLAVLLHVFYETPIPDYEIFYSPIVFMWTMILFIFPLSVFLFADAQYVFGFDANKKNLLEIFAKISSLKVKEDEMKKVDKQEKFFHEHFELFSAIKSTGDEIKFLKGAVSKALLIVTCVTTVSGCIVHWLVPLLFQVFSCHYCAPPPNITTYNMTKFNAMLNRTTFVIINVTEQDNTPYTAYKVVLGLATVNSFAESLFASCYFVFVALWKIVMLREWKRFNSNERDSSKTFINNGPQGIAMWWKIRQKLKLFSTSSLSMSVVIGKMQCVVNLICIVGLSTTLVLNTFAQDETYQLALPIVVPIVIDLIMLYSALMIIGCLSFFIDQEQSKSTHEVQLKQLNICYELGRYMNMEQEAIDNEPSVKVKVRVMRGCSVLLQELTSAMGKLERGASSRLNIGCFLLASIVMFPCLIVSFYSISR